MPTVDKIIIEGFKSIASAEVELRPVNVLIGANGSGKSNFIGAFAFLQAIRSGRLQDYVARVGGADRILHFGSKVTDKLTISVSESNGCQYDVTLAPADGGGLCVISESFRARNDINEEKDSSPASADKWRKESGLDCWRLYDFHETGPGSPMNQPCDLNDNLSLRPDGSNLAAFLYRIRQEQPNWYDMILFTIQRVAPFIEDFRLEPMTSNRDKIRLEWRHKGYDACLDTAALSGGTRRFVALTSALLLPEKELPPVILLDLPESELHPYAVTLLAALADKASVDSQVILATQSPRMVDQFRPQDVLVLDRVGGKTKFTRLEPDGLDKWLERQSLGELWEVNHFEGNPAGAWKNEVGGNPD